MLLLGGFLRLLFFHVLGGSDCAYNEGKDVSRFLKWDSDLQTEVLSPWTYYGHNIETGESVEMVVDDSDVITPELITHYYSIVPVLWFPDGTSFVMEDFFDEGSFAKLIDDYNDIINTYLSITGQK